MDPQDIDRGLAAPVQASFDATLLFALVTIVAFAGFITLFVFVRKRGISWKPWRFTGWFLLLLFLFGLDLFVVRSIGSPVASGAVAVGKVVVAWLFIRRFLNDFYAEAYLRGVRKKPVNHIYLDVVKFAALVFLAFWALKTVFGVGLESLLTSSAIVTAAVGFAMQDTIDCFISGLLIQLEKPFGLGDWIGVEGLEGKVVQIGWRYTKIETIDKYWVVIPNNAVSKARLVNHNEPTPFYRKKLRVGVAYDVPPVRVKTALREILDQTALVAKDPPPVVQLVEYGDSSITYELMFYVSLSEDVRAVTDAVNSSVWYQFQRHGIEIPFPIRTVIVAKKKGAGAEAPELAILSAMPLFAGMPEEDLSVLVRSSGVKSYPAGGRIVSRGDTDTTLFVILEGTVAVQRDGANLAELGHGGFFGEMALLTGEPRSADVCAKTPTRCLVVDREGFRMLLARNPQVAKNVEEMFASRRAASCPVDAGHGEEHPEARSLLALFRKIFS